MNIYSCVIREGEIMEEKINIDNCCCNIVHEDIIEKVRAKMLSDDITLELSEFFKVFGDFSRLKILRALMLSEMCVCDLTVLLGMNQSAVSHQLKLLRQSKLVRFRRDGKVIYYSLDDGHIKGIFDLGLVHINEK
jgi:ArsR family transcriptional regulator, lead/cadmium/zinc/bismuth-responsive transcriptional repressor